MFEGVALFSSGRRTGGGRPRSIWAVTTSQEARHRCGDTCRWYQRRTAGRLIRRIVRSLRDVSSHRASAARIGR